MGLMLGFMILTSIGIVLQFAFDNALWIELLGFLPAIGIAYCLVRAAIAFGPFAHALKQERLGNGQ